MSHLGRWLSALVDEELDGAERDRVLNHLARCQPCRQEANALRALKRRMTALGDNAADSAIAGRLIELARSDSDLVGRAAYSPWAATWLASPPGGPALGRHQIRSSWMLAVGSAGVALTAIGAVAFMLGGPQPAPAPRITPAVEVFWQQHGYDTGQAPAGQGSASSPAAQPGATGRAAARPAGRPSARPGSAGSSSARAVRASSPPPRPGSAGRPSVPSAAFRPSP